MIYEDQPFHYEWLLKQIAAYDEILSASGVSPGAVVAIKGDYTPYVVAALLALIDRAAICVPLSPSVAAQHSEFQEIAEVQLAVTPDAGGLGEVKPLRGAPSNELTR